MPDVTLDAADAAELAELLQFLTGWLARDPGRLAASLEESVGHPAYRISRSSLVLPRSAQRKLARQTGYKLRDGPAE